MIRTVDVIRDAQNGYEITDAELRTVGEALRYCDWSQSEAEGLGLKPGWFDVQQELVRRYRALPVVPRPTTPRRQLVRCGCGHFSFHPMTTAHGTACEDCYDRLSE